MFTSIPSNVMLWFSLKKNPVIDQSEAIGPWEKFEFIR